MAIVTNRSVTLNALSRYATFLAADEHALSVYDATNFTADGDRAPAYERL